MMDAKSEVILRQSSYFSGQLLLVNPPQDQLCQALTACATQIWTWNFADHHYFQQHALASHFSISAPQHAFDQVIIFIPKAKEQLNYVLEQCAALLSIGACIFLVGEKKAGIERAAKQLIPYGRTMKLDSARHCQLWQLALTQIPTLKPLSAWIKTYQYQHKHVKLDICALPGVFSQDHLDMGTQQLLPYLAQIKTGQILDFGCGAGIISAVLAKQDQLNHITAVDIDAFALTSTELTFAENGLSAQLSCQAVTDIQDLQQDFDAIVSNPPFHQGIQTDYRASENLCQYAFNHLKHRGELWIVANRFLNYAPFIEKNFSSCEIKADQQGFKIFFAQK